MVDPTLQSIAEAGAAAHERFVNDMAEIDRAWMNGRLDEWLQEKLADERNAAGAGPAAA
jgi:hypothetical protein